ncbi:MAG TPA: ATP-dependent helicase HrpB [Moraxellaceae bacterium]|nr:ATP-dependent helicase HrpB [Moraxellaceae bacterium]
MSLPIDALLPALRDTLAQTSALVLQAPPGTGKTTRVPLALLDAPWLAGKRIVMLEPRRLAARSAARYMATLLGEDVGRTVGYRTRLDTKVGPSTRIEVVTEGILTRLLQDDATLESYGAVIFDEFHERSLQADLGLALVRECQQVLREDLRLVVMSATLDAAGMARVLGEVPVLSCTGQNFPVELRYAPAGRLPLLDHVVSVVRDVVRHEKGSVLVFLPGEGEIRRVAEALEGTLPDDALLAPLYGQLAAEAQDLAISPAPAGVRKIVLATSIAETSLTIEGIRVVIDSGQLRLPRFDPDSAMTRLVTQRLSAANAEQRRGRAGRVEPGVCIRLWSEDEQTRLQPFAPPEILQADLTGTVLELAHWGVADPATLAWLDTPPAANWSQARELLQQLEALDEQGHVTAHGKAMLRLGLAPRLGHMVLRGRERGLGKLAADLAALLSERDLLPRGHGADIHDRLAALRGEQTFPGLDRGRLRLVRDSARRLEARSATAGRPETNDDAGRLLALAYPDHIGQRRPGSEARFRLSNGRGAVLPPEDRLAREAWIVAAEMDGTAREARIFLAAPVSLMVLEEELGAVVTDSEAVSWDAQAQAVLARRQRRLGALVLEDRPLADADPARVKTVLCDAIRQKGIEILPWTPELRQWQARVQLMHALEPEQWPDASDAALLESLDEWAGPFLDGMTRFSHLEKFPLRDALTSLLDWPRQQRLDQELPPRLTVPSGSAIAIDYTTDHHPVLSVKLQEMFGLTATPRLAGGRVPLTIHLLSPAQRPVAVTQDLASFWANAYAEVRKDLRGRYPRHPWPEDPLAAPAQRGVKKRGE